MIEFGGGSMEFTINNPPNLNFFIFMNDLAWNIFYKKDFENNDEK